MINKVTLNGTEVPGIVRDTFHYKARAGVPGPFRVGGVFGSSIEFDYFTPSAVTISKGDVIEYYQTVDVDSTFAPITPSQDIWINNFNVIDVVVGKRTTHITAYDDTVKLNTDFSKHLASIESSFPMKINDLITEVCNVSGLTYLRTYPLANWFYYKVGYFYADGITCRDIVNYIAEIFGGYADCSNGIIDFTRLGYPMSSYWNTPDYYVIAPDNSNYQFGTKWYCNVWYKENGLQKKTQTIPYDGVRIVNTSGTILGQYDGVVSPQKMYYLTGNILVDSLTDLHTETYTDFAQRIYSILNYSVTLGPPIGTLRPVPTTVKLFPFRMPFVRGECVYVVDTDGTKTIFPVMSIDLSDSEVILEGYGHEDTDTGYGTSYGLEDNQTLLTTQVNSLYATVDGLVSNQPTRDLLWTNSDPASSFAAQTIPLDLSNYDIVEISFNTSTSSTGQDSAVNVFGSPDGRTVQTQWWGRLTTAAYPQIEQRLATITTSGVEFSACIAKAANSNSAASNSNGNLVPMYIYGIKF